MGTVVIGREHDDLGNTVENLKGASVMFRLRDKLKYIVFMGLLVLVGFVFGNMNNDTDAQSKSDTVDKLTVRKLTVLEDITVIADDGEPRVVISWDEDGGKVTCLGPERIRAADLLVGEMGGVIAVFGRNGGGAGLSVDETGGAVAIFPVDGKNGGAALSISDDGDGLIITRDRFDEFRAWGQ